MVAKRIMGGCNAEATLSDGRKRGFHLGPAMFMSVPFDQMPGFVRADGVGLWVFEEHKFPAFDMAVVDFGAKVVYLVQVTVTEPFDDRHRTMLHRALTGDVERTLRIVLACYAPLTDSVASRLPPAAADAQAVVRKLLGGNVNVQIELLPQPTPHGDKRESEAVKDGRRTARAASPAVTARKAKARAPAQQHQFRVQIDGNFGLRVLWVSARPLRVPPPPFPNNLVEVVHASSLGITVRDKPKP
jgi:hypothetical protein